MGSWKASAQLELLKSWRELCPGEEDLKNLVAFIVFILSKNIVHCVIAASECII